MCELLIRVADKVGTDPAVNVFCTFSGDVVDVFEDGQVYGATTLANRDWRIIKLPNVSKDTVLDLLEPQWKLEADGSRQAIRKRARYLDFDSLPNQVKNAIMAATEPITFNVSQQTALNAVRKTKTPLVVTVG